MIPLPKMSFVILMAVIFFLLTAGFPGYFEAIKKFVLHLGTALALILYLMERMQGASFSPPRSLALVGAGFIIVFSFVSSFLSGAPLLSLVGTGGEGDTFEVMALISILLVLSALIFQEKTRLFGLYLVIIISSLALFVFGVVNVLFLDIQDNFNLLGSWNDLGMFMGLVTVISLAALEFLPLTPAWRILFTAAVAVSLLSLLLVNFYPAWIMTAVFTFIV